MMASWRLWDLPCFSCLPLVRAPWGILSLGSVVPVPEVLGEQTEIAGSRKLAGLEGMRAFSRISRRQYC